MRWVKKGLIIQPTGELDWMVTHASMPFADRIRNNVYRVYFCGRNEQCRAQMGYIEIDINEPEEILDITEKPVLELGSLGAFDDTGVWPSWMIHCGDISYMYYTGRMAGITVPFYSCIGLAISHDGGKTFERFSRAPIIGRNNFDPYLIATPSILVENGIWRMWYSSGVRWDIVNGQPKHYYNIKYAESDDGINWNRDGVVCIDFKSADEYALGRPCVMKDEGIYKMWYSHRGESYRLGYAESKDGMIWERKDDEVGIDVSGVGWDSEMICYAHVVNHEGKKYMLYNGNSYGKTGLGYAVSSENT